MLAFVISIILFVVWLAVKDILAPNASNIECFVNFIIQGVLILAWVHESPVLEAVFFKNLLPSLCDTKGMKDSLIP